MPDATGAKRVFLSYARRDADKVDTLEEGLRSLGADVWLDDALVGGHEWWQAILSEIRQRDVFVQAISPAGIDSEACTRERAYALALGKPVVPVVIDVIDVSLLPDDLSRLQLVGYIDPEPEHAFRLARAVASSPPAPPLPDPLPAPPEVPVSYLQGLHARVRATTLTFDDQLALVGRLESALERDSEHDEACRLLRLLSERDDLYHSPAVRIDRLLGAPEAELDTADREALGGGPAERSAAPDPWEDEDRDRDRDRERERDDAKDALDRGQHMPAVRPVALTCSALAIAALAALPGGALREITGPEDAEPGTELLAIVFARTIGWAIIVAAVAAVIARHMRSERASTAAWHGLVAGAVAGLAGGLVHGLLGYMGDTELATARLLGLAVTGAIAGLYFGTTLAARLAGTAGGLAGGLVAGILVYDWPGNDAPFALGTGSWVLHSAPICLGAIGLAALRYWQLARREQPVSPPAPALKT